jgi:hypothetical protein
MTRSTLLCALLSGAVSLPSLALPIHYDFQAAPDDHAHDSIQLTKEGVTVTVTAWTTEVFYPRLGLGLQVTSAMGSYGGENAGVYYGSSGLGIFLGNADDTYNADGANFTSILDRPEGFLLSFDRVVELTNINFNSWGVNDTALILAVTNFSPINPDYPGFPSPLTHGVVDYGYGASDHYVGSHMGNRFWVRAYWDDDAFRIQDIDIHVVPEPGSLALLGLGLGMVAWSSRRRATGME